MRRIIKQGLVVALALGTLGSTAWASDKMSRWEGFCYAMQADVNAETIQTSTAAGCHAVSEGSAHCTHDADILRDSDCWFGNLLQCNDWLADRVHRHIARTAAKQQGWRKLGDTTYMALF